MNNFLKNSKTLKLILPGLYLFFLGSCLKSLTQSKTDRLTNGKWSITVHKEYYAGLGFPPRDLYASYPSCKKDNYYVFTKDGSGEINQGPTKCNSGDPQVTQLIWRFTNNDTHISIFSADWKIVQLDETNFIITSVQVIGGDGETITFTKI